MPEKDGGRGEGCRPLGPRLFSPWRWGILSSRDQFVYARVSAVSANWSGINVTRPPRPTSSLFRHIVIEEMSCIHAVLPLFSSPQAPQKSKFRDKWHKNEPGCCFNQCNLGEDAWNCALFLSLLNWIFDDVNANIGNLVPAHRHRKSQQALNQRQIKLNVLGLESNTKNKRASGWTLKAVFVQFKQSDVLNVLRRWIKAEFHGWIRAGLYVCWTHPSSNAVLKGAGLHPRRSWRAKSVRLIPGLTYTRRTC